MTTYRTGSGNCPASRPETDSAARGYMPALDGIRGLAALMVAFYHFEGPSGEVGIPRCYLAVDLFFVMSAFVLWSSYGRRFGADTAVSDFIRTRLVRLVPLYLFGTAIGIVVACFTKGMPTPGEVALAALMLPDLRGATIFPFDPPAWSLFFEVIASIALAAFATRITLPRLVIALCAGLAAIAAIAMFKATPDVNMGFTARGLPGGAARTLAGFALGIILARCPRASVDALTRRLPTCLRPGAAPAWLPLLLTFAVLAAPVTGRSALPYDLAVMAFACPVIVALAAAARPGPRLSALLKIAGIASFPLYAIHVPVGYAVAAVAARCGLGSDAPATLAAMLVLSVLLALAADRWFDRPVRRALATRRSHRRATAAIAAVGAAATA